MSVRPVAYGRVMSMTTTEPLTGRDHDILRFEAGWWKYTGAKDQAIRDQFDMTPTRYYQVLNALLDNPAALAAHPTVIPRLRRLRDQRKAARARR